MIMKRLLFAALFAALSLPLAATAQEGVTVADGTQTVNTQPMRLFTIDHGFRNETLYPASMLTGLDGETITSLTWYSHSAANYANLSWGTFSAEVRLGEVDDSSFASQEWLLDSAAQLCYTGTMSVVEHEMTIILDEPYTYGGGNLVIDIFCTGGGTYSLCFFLGEDAAASGIYAQSTSGTHSFDADATVTTDVLPKMRLGTGTPTAPCLMPGAISVSNIGATGADLAWSAGGSEAEWEVYLDSQLVATVDTPGYALTQLSPSSAYTVGVAAVCTDGSSSWRTTIFHTSCDAVSQLPWAEDFEGYDGLTSAPNTDVAPNCWTTALPYVSDLSHYPYIQNTTSGAHSGTKCLYFSSYSQTNCILALPPFEEPMDNLQLIFFARGGSLGGQMSVGYLPNADNTDSFVEVQSITNLGSTYTRFEIDMPDTAMGLIAFNFHKYDVRIDDVEVRARVSCPTLDSLAVSALGFDQATISFTDPAEMGNYVAYLYTSDGAVADSEFFGSTSYTFVDLWPQTDYTVAVQSICDEGTRTAAISTSFRTTCEPVTIGDDGWIETFEDYTSSSSNPTPLEIPCYATINPYQMSGNYYPIVTNQQHHDGAKSLYHFTYSNNATLFVLPPLSNQLEDLHLRFFAQGGEGAMLTVGVIADLDDPTTYTVLDTVNLGSAWQRSEMVFEPGTTGRIAFAMSGGQVWLDDIRINLFGGCLTPSGITAFNPTETSIYVNIDDPLATGNYHLVWTDGQTADSMDVYTTTALIADLHPSTTYSLSASVNCASGETTDAVGTVFTTACGLVELPWSENFDAAAADQPMGCWESLRGYNNNWEPAQGNVKVDGSQRLYMRSAMNSDDGEGNALAVLPRLEAAINQMDINFDVTMPNASDVNNFVLEIGAVDDSTDVGNFQSLATVSGLAAGETVNFSHSLADAPRAEGRLALRFTYNNTNSYYWLWVDNISITFNGAAPWEAPADTTTTDTTGTNPTDDTVWHTLTVNCNVSGAAEPYGSGTYAHGETVQIGYILADTATTGGHWQFLGWSDGAAGNPHNVVLVSDSTVTAQFQWVADTTGSTDTTGISPLPTLHSPLSIYPNPATSTVTLDGIEWASEVNILDVSGRVVATYKTSVPQLTVNVGTLERGTYFIRATGPQAIGVRKLVLR